MFGTLLKIGVVVVLAAAAGEFLSPPFSCWLLHVVSPRDGGGAGSAMVLVQPGGGVGAVMARLSESPSLRSGSACRAALLPGLR